MSLIHPIQNTRTDKPAASRVTRRRFLAGTAALAAASACEFYAPTIIRAAENKWGDLVGRLSFDGKPPARAKLVVDKDVDCCGKFDIRDESLMVGDDRGLQNVFIYLRSTRVEVNPALAEAVDPRVTLDNRDCIFKPHCMQIWFDKQEFYIVNSDPVAQNVAFSPLGDVPANIVLAVGGDATYRFSRRQLLPVPIACNYHPWESAYILPRDNPYMAITAPDGTFCIPQLPPGEHEFQVWHERVGPLETPQWPKGRMKVTVQAGTNDLGTVQIEPAWLVK